MDILIIISQFSPAQTPNTLRWRPLAQHLRAEGHAVSILTTKRRGVAEESEIDGLKVYRAGYNTLLDRLYDLFNSKQRRNEEGSSTGGEAGIASGLLQGIANQFWRKNYWPDGSKLFVKPGINLGQTIIDKNKIDKVISVGLPFSSHWIAKALKEKNPNLHWLMDIQDPFCYSKEFRVNNFDKYQKKNIKAEGDTFRLADKISMTNERAKEKYKEYFPKQMDKVTVIPPMFSEATSDSYYDMYLYSEKIHIGYFGSFYEGVRSPKKFFDFITFIWKKDKSLLEKYQFHFVGQIDRETAALISSYHDIRRCFVLHGFKNRDKTLSAMKQVDVLLNFGNSTDYHLPSKVVDYLYMDKPIINISSIDNDSTANFFSDETVPFLNLKLDELNHQRHADQFFKFLEKDHGEGQQSVAKVENYTVRQIAKAYRALLEG